MHVAIIAGSARFASQAPRAPQAPKGTLRYPWRPVSPPRHLEIAPRVGEVRLQCEGALEHVDRFVQPAERGERDAYVVECLHRLGRELQHGAEFRFGLRELTLFQQSGGARVALTNVGFRSLDRPDSIVGSEQALQLRRLGHDRAQVPAAGDGSAGEGACDACLRRAIGELGDREVGVEAFNERHWRAGAETSGAPRRDPPHVHEHRWNTAVAEVDQRSLSMLQDGTIVGDRRGVPCCSHERLCRSDE